MSSIQEQRYLLSRHVEGSSLSDAAFEAGISELEAALIDKAVARGELALPAPSTGGDPPAPVLPLKAARKHLFGGTGPPPPPAPGRLLAAITPPPETGAPITEGETTMGRKAAAANDVEEIPQPDFERAIKILKHDLNPLTEDSAKIRGDQSAAWKTIESDCHCNKKGMKFVHSLMRMDPEIRDDVLRTLYGGMRAAGIGISRDLVDRMGAGEAPTMPVSDDKATTTADLPALAAAE